MAPKRANPIEVPPAVSSGEEEDEEEVTSSDDEEEQQGSSTEEDEEDPKTQSTSFIQDNPPPENPGDEESGSDSDSDSDSDTAIPNAKPIATKPMVSPVKASPSSKRPVESDIEAKVAKRPKKIPGEEGSNSASTAEVKKSGGEDAKKQLFQRLFTEEDEIALLKGILDYYAKKGADPCADMNAFYDFVKKSIKTDVTKAQVMDKIRRLRKKFENNAGKGKQGEDRTFSKAHEHNTFELSKKIWGKEGISGKVESSAAKSNGKAKANSKAMVALKAELSSSPNKKVDGGVPPMKADNKKAPPESFGSIFDKRFDVASVEEKVLKLGFDMVDGEKKAALEAKWRNIQIRELELFVERSEMINDLAKSMLKAYKSEDK